jgi:RNA polymerase sigma factor (sigma-70 family)
VDGAIGTVRPVREEPPAFEVFFEAEYGRLLKVLYLITGSRTEAEDLAQEAMARALERWQRVSTMERPGGYVYRMALNLNRKRLRHLSVVARQLVGARDREEPSLEERTEVRMALDSLPRPTREALVLIDWLGLDAAEAGRLLGIRPGSVRSRVSRARSALRDRMGEDDA